MLGQGRGRWAVAQILTLIQTDRKRGESHFYVLVSQFSVRWTSFTCSCIWIILERKCVLVGTKVLPPSTGKIIFHLHRVLSTWRRFGECYDTHWCMQNRHWQNCDWKRPKKKKAVEMLILNVLVKDKSTPESLASSQQNKHINRELVRSD